MISLVHGSLADKEGAGLHGDFTLSVLRPQEVWGSVLLVIKSLFHLVGVFRSAKQLRTCLSILLSRCFQDELKQRMWGRPVQEGPIGSSWLHPHTLTRKVLVDG